MANKKIGRQHEKVNVNLAENEMEKTAPVSGVKLETGKVIIPSGSKTT